MKKYLNIAMILLLSASCSQKENKESITSQQALKVGIKQARLEKVNTIFNYSGTVEPVQTIPLSFQTTGTVEQVMVEAGDVVKKGQVLAIINENDARNLYQVAQARYSQAKDAYDRLKKVHDDGSLPEIKWIEMETNLSQAKSSLEISKSNLDKCRLVSPVNGVIGRRNIEPGMPALSLAMAPLEIVDTRQLYIKISVPENEIVKISKGMKASGTVSALNNLLIHGEISHVTPVADRISRTYEVKILVTNPDKALRPGMVCDVSLDIAGEREMVLVPYQSITVDNNNNAYVFVADTGSGKAKKVFIKTGQYHNENVEVLSGLQGNESVVIEGKERLSDNCQIAL